MPTLLAFVLCSALGQSHPDSAGSHILSVFDKYIELNLALRDSSAESGYDEALAEALDFQEKVYVRRLREAKAMILANSNENLLRAILDVVTVSRFLRQNYEAFVLGELFVARTPLVMRLYLERPVSQREVIFPVLERGFVDVTYRNPEAPVNYDSLRTVMIDLRPQSSPDVANKQ